ncbi:hypothetical protein HMN09_00842200 [Mycena chlorophos]|uniref:Uncharacterized protein n=1 Tax=Mycena chlorophos TaxID=658473 RepID=A0A8H6SRY6_MYCCL|nr:hypothetical protein HMN09_00842200 [Mycena chlorophos]
MTKYPTRPSNDLPPKIHRKPMEERWEVQYKAGIEKQQRRQREQDEKREQAQRAQTQIQICYYAEEDEDPQLVQEQGLPHLPQFNPSLHPRLLHKLDLTADDEVYIYDHDSGLWSRRDVNSTFLVVSGQTLILRSLNVRSSHCQRLDQMITIYAPTTATSRSLKRKAEPVPNTAASQPRTPSNPRPRRHNSLSPLPSPALSVMSMSWENKPEPGTAVSHGFPLLPTAMVYACCPRCSARIPAAQLSKGVRNPANKGYWYQRCPRCSWFQWLAFRPDEPPPTSDNHLDSGDPGGSSPPIPPTEFPLDPELYYEGLAGLPAGSLPATHHTEITINDLHRAIPPTPEQQQHHTASPTLRSLPPRPIPTPRTHARRRHVAEVHRQVVQTAVQE